MIFALSLFSFTLLHGMKRPASPTAKKVNQLPAEIRDIFMQHYVEKEKLQQFIASYPQKIEVVLMAPTRPGSLLPMLMGEGPPARLSDIMKRATISEPPKVGDVLVWKGGNEWDWTRGTVAEGPDGSLVLKDVRVNFCPITADMTYNGMLPQFAASDQYQPRVGGRPANIEFSCAYDRDRHAMLTEDRHCLPASGMHGAERDAGEWQTWASYRTVTDEGYAQAGCCCHHHHDGERTAELTITSQPDDEEDAEEFDMEDLQRKLALMMGAADHWVSQPCNREWIHARQGYSLPEDIPEVADQMAATELTDEAASEIMQSIGDRLRGSGIYIDTSDLEQVREAIKPENVRETMYALESAPRTMEGHCSSNGKQGSGKIVMNRGGEVITPRFLLDHETALPAAAGPLGALADLQEAFAGAMSPRSEQSELAEMD